MEGVSSDTLDSGSKAIMSPNELVKEEKLNKNGSYKCLLFHVWMRKLQQCHGAESLLYCVRFHENLNVTVHRLQGQCEKNISIVISNCFCN